VTGGARVATAAKPPATIDAKHLDYLQTAIGRMASQSFLVKGWSVTLAAAALGLAVKENHRAFALVGVLPVAILW
jgi:hypothetical protein